MGINNNKYLIDIKKKINIEKIHPKIKIKNKRIPKIEY